MAACCETVAMAGCLTLWHSYIHKISCSALTVNSTPRKMFEYYIYQKQQKKSNIRSIMQLWWTHENNFGKTNGELLNDEIEKFFKENKSIISPNGSKRFDIDQFVALFEDVNIGEPILDFYSFFNPQTRTFIRYIDLPRVRNVPLTGSRYSIKTKYDKHFFLVESYLEKIYKTYYESNMFNGKKWDDYITDIVVDNISAVCSD